MTRARDLADSGLVINSLDNLNTTLTGAELSVLDGITATTAELNILDGVTSTAVEINLLDGVTATTAELNYVDGVTSNIQTQINTKSPTASPTFTGTATAPTVNASTALQIGGAAITSTPAELNLLDGVTASTTEINYLDGVTSAIQPQITAAAASGGGGGDVAAYKVTTTFTAPVYFKKVDIIPNNTTVAGTWELFADAELWVSELATISSNDEYLTATESKSNHIFYGTLYIGDDAAVTVTDTMQGLGDAAASAASASASKSDFSAVDSGGMGSFDYNSTTGAYTYTGPSLGKVMFLGGI